MKYSATPMSQLITLLIDTARCLPEHAEIAAEIDRRLPVRGKAFGRYRVANQQAKESK